MTKSKERFCGRVTILHGFWKMCKISQVVSLVERGNSKNREQHEWRHKVQKSEAISESHFISVSLHRAHCGNESDIR